MRYQTTMTADGSELLCEVIRRHDAQRYEGTIFVTGTPGGGSFALEASFDGGTTKQTVVDLTGTPVSGTIIGSFTFPIAGDSGALGNNLQLYTTLTGATAPNVTFTLYDNR